MRTCRKGHEVAGENAIVRTDFPGKFKCRICDNDCRREAYRRRVGLSPHLEDSRVMTLGLYEDYLAMKKPGVRDSDIAEILGVHRTSLCRVKVKFGHKGD